MTKKELLESEFFKHIPDNTEIVFNTDIKGENCHPLRESDIGYRQEIVGWAKREINPETGERDNHLGADPIYRHFLVINTNPY